MSLIKHFFAAESPPAQFYRGRGISIAFLDTGISPVEDFILPRNRIIAFRDLVNGKKEPYDDNGHGTHVTGTKPIQEAKTIIRKAPLYSDALTGAQFFEPCIFATQAYESIKDHSDSQAIGMVFYYFLWFSPLYIR